MSRPPGLVMLQHGSAQQRGHHTCRIYVLSWFAGVACALSPETSRKPPLPPPVLYNDRFDTWREKNKMRYPLLKLLGALLLTAAVALGQTAQPTPTPDLRSPGKPADAK